MFSNKFTDEIESLIQEARTLARREPETACALARKAVRFTEVPGVSADIRAQALRILTRVTFESGHTAESAEGIRLLEELLPSCSPVVRAGCRSNLGWIAYMSGEISRALNLTRDALETQVILDDVEGELWSRNNLAAIYRAHGLVERAVALYIANRNRSRQVGNRLLEGGALLNLSMIHNERKDHTAALQASEESLRLMDDSNDGYARILIRAQRVQALLGLGRLDEALEASEELLLLPQPNPMAVALVHFERSHVFRYRQEFDAALAAAEEGIGQARPFGEPYLLMLGEKALALEGLGRLSEAAQMTRTVLAEQDRLHLRSNRVSVLELAARLAEKQHRYKQALEYHQQIRVFEQEQASKDSENLRILFSVDLDLENTKREAEEERARSARFAEAASRDGMTGLYNHATFQQLLCEMVRKDRIAVVLVDVDNFKAYNDRFGHPAGDRLLKELARLMTAHCRQKDILARYGGEEFALLIPYGDTEQVYPLVERLRAAVADHPFPHDGVTVSIGLACSPPHPQDPHLLVEAADRALYTAKHSGKNRIVVAS